MISIRCIDFTIKCHKFKHLNYIFYFILSLNYFFYIGFYVLYNNNLIFFSIIKKSPNLVMVIVILNILSEIVIIKNFLFIQIEMIYMEIFFFFIDFNFIKYYYLLDFIFKVLIKQFLIHSIFDFIKTFII